LLVDSNFSLLKFKVWNEAKICYKRTFGDAKNNYLDLVKNHKTSKFWKDQLTRKSEDGVQDEDIQIQQSEDYKILSALQDFDWTIGLSFGKKLICTKNSSIQISDFRIYFKDHFQMCIV
jgi:hypothetical protein